MALRLLATGGVHRPPTRGFTLIELMVVLGIIAIAATIAMATTVGNRPRIRLLNTVADMRLELLEARTAAVKSGRNHKVCIFSDDNSTDTSPKGRIVVFKCGSTGLSSCPTPTTICTANTNASTGTQWTTANVDAACADPAKWCLVSDLSLAVAPYAENRVSINGFRTATGAASSLKSIEITYTAMGWIAAPLSTTDFVSGNIVFTSYDMAQGGGFTNTPSIRYVAGGGARIQE